MNKNKDKTNINSIKINNQTSRKSRGRPGRRTKEMVAIAKERIRILMALAEEVSGTKANFNRARRYIELARNIGMRYNVRLGKEFNIKFCRTCNSYLGSSSMVRVRYRCGKMIISCKNCGRMKRITYR